MTDIIEELIQSLLNGDESEREKAIIKLWNSNDMRAVQPIINAFNDKSYQVREYAIRAFRYLKNEQAVVSLIELFKKEANIGLKGEIAETLSMLRDKRAIEPLSEILKQSKDSDKLVCGGMKYHEVIKNALKRLGGLPNIEKPEDLQGKARETALALKSWYRDKAILWWRNNGNESAICDDGNETLLKNEGYLRPGNYLGCEGHTNLFLCNTDWDEALKDLNRYFGPGVPEYIISIFKK